MCRISKIGDDWIVKGFHLHVHDVELVMRPNHKGSIIFKKCFRSTPDREAQPAIGRASQLLTDITWHQRFYRELERARRFVQTSGGRLSDLANGRAAEFTFLLVALRKNGDRLMASLDEFLTTGRLGEIAVGASKDFVRQLLGEPEDVSTQRNPELWKYGAIQLGFHKGKGAKLAALHFIGLYFQSGKVSIPDA